MGCCASRPQGAGGRNDAVRAQGSSHNITAPSTRPGSVPSLPGSHASQSNLPSSGNRPDMNNRPNTPLKAILASQRSRLPNTLASPVAKGRGRVQPLTDSTNFTWTHSRLERERTDFWDTQVTGSPEVWGAIRLATQYLQAGELQEAQTMLDVTGCTCPTGCLWKGVYDSTGIMYKVPEWLVVEPDGLVEESHAASQAVPGPASPDASQETDDEDEDDIVLVRVRISSDQRDVPVSIRKREPVASILEKLKKHAQLDLESKVRLAYGGRLYQDFETLESNLHWNFANDYLLTALVFV